MIETAHKLIISWGMTAGAWHRGCIKLRTENPGPGEFRFPICWSLARMPCLGGQGKVGWCWSSSGTPPDSDPASGRKYTSPYFCWHCSPDCLSSRKAVIGCHYSCFDSWSFDDLGSGDFVGAAVAKTSWTDMQDWRWQPQLRLLCPQLAQLGFRMWIWLPL